MKTIKNSITSFIAILVVVLFAVIWIFIANSLNNVKNAEFQNAENNLQNTARSFKTHSESTILNADQILKIIKINYEKNGDNSFEFLKSYFPISVGVQQFFNQFGIIDKSGMYVFSNLPNFKKIDLSDREHFKIHFNPYKPEIFISKPVLGRASNKWSIQLSRRLEDQQGEFNGAVVISIDPFYFIKFYKKINLGNKGLVALVDKDGFVRTLSSGDFSSFDGTAPKLELPGDISQNDFGLFKSNSVFDKESRLYAYEQLQNQPMYVLVGMSEDDVFSQYYQIRRNYILFGALLSILLTASSMVILRMLKNSFELNTKLQDNYEKVQLANIAKTNFLATMSHEIRTPLNGILGLSERLLNQNIQAETRTKYLQTIIRSGELLKNILNDILETAKVESGKLEIVADFVNLNTLGEEIVTLFSEQASQKNIAIHFEAGISTSEMYFVDVIRIHQMLSNFLSNAIKFTENGSVTLVIKEVSRDGDKVQLEFGVKDTGKGISPTDQELLFKPFSQIRSSTLEPSTGSGLGLSIVKGFADAMHGKIGIDSALGKGSYFWFSIPSKVKSPPTQNHDNLADDVVNNDSVRSDLKKIRILVVDDNATNRMVLEAMLEDFHCEVTSAEDGAKALLEFFKGEPFDLVLMDIQMPIMNGIEASEAILLKAAEEHIPRVPIVAVSAFAYEEDRQKFISVGMMDLIPKPIDIAELRRVIFEIFPYLSN